MGAYQRKHESVLYPKQGDALDGSADGLMMEGSYGRADGSTYENPELGRQIVMGNAAAAEYVEDVATEPGTPAEAPQPFPDKLGTPEWYDARHNDHVRRHLGEPPPPTYYLDYGKKYCLRFSEVLYPKLSKEGQRWLVLTRTNLQLAIERALLRDPVGFDKLESNSAAFKAFAFGTHKQSYLAGGLESLPVADLIAIALTPDIGDLATMDGISQVLATGAPVSVTQAGEFVTEGGMMMTREKGEKWLEGDPEAESVPFQGDETGAESSGLFE